MRTSRWWSCLGLPTDENEKQRLRHEYAEKLRAHRQGLQENPLAETRLEAACAPVRLDIAAGLGFPPGHPFGLLPADPSPLAASPLATGGEIGGAISSAVSSSSSSALSSMTLGEQSDASAREDMAAHMVRLFCEYNMTTTNRIDAAL